MVARLLAGLINFFLILAEGFLAIRVILRFFAANPDTPFVEWVYKSSDTLLAPFRGIFPTEVVHQNNAIDFTAIFAMMIYGLLALAFASLLRWLAPPVVVEKKR